MYLALCTPHSKPLKNLGFCSEFSFLYMNGLQGLRKRQDFSGARAAKKSFLKEVQSELCLGTETWLEQGLESEAVLIDAAVLQSPICAKSTEVNPCKLVFYLYHHPQQHHHPPHHHYFHFTDGEAETSPKPHKNWSLVLGFKFQIKDTPGSVNFKRGYTSHVFTCSYE